MEPFGAFWSLLEPVLQKNNLNRELTGMTANMERRQNCFGVADLARSLLKNYNTSSCGGADALTSLLLPLRSQHRLQLGALEETNSVELRGQITADWLPSPPPDGCPRNVIACAIRGVIASAALTI